MDTVIYYVIAAAVPLFLAQFYLNLRIVMVLYENGHRSFSSFFLWFLSRSSRLAQLDDLIRGHENEAEKRRWKNLEKWAYAVMTLNSIVLGAFFVWFITSGAITESF